jgi:hypothetical protein
MALVGPGVVVLLRRRLRRLPGVVPLQQVREEGEEPPAMVLVRQGLVVLLRRRLRRRLRLLGAVQALLALLRAVFLLSLLLLLHQGHQGLVVVMLPRLRVAPLAVLLR